MPRLERITRSSTGQAKEKCARDILRYLTNRELEREVTVYANSKRFRVVNHHVKPEHDIKASDYVEEGDDDLLAICFADSEFYRQLRYGNGGYARPRILQDFNAFLARRGLKVILLGYYGYITEV
jgi:hypothetical protein